MSRTTLNAPDNTHRPPNTGDSTELGDSYSAVITNLNTMLTEVYGAWASGSVGTFQGGGSSGATGQYKASGNVVKTPGPISSSGTNTTQTLASYTMPASLFNASGQEIVATAWGTTANNAAPKSIVMNMGGTFVSTGTQTGAQYAWELVGTYMRAGAANTQNAFFAGVASGGVVTQKNQTDTSVETGTIAVTVTCADASAATNNIVLFGFTVEYYG